MAIGIVAAVAGEFAPFKDPKTAIAIPLQVGLVTDSGAHPVWRDLGYGFSSQTSIKTHRGAMRRVGDIDNDVTCTFGGKGDAIESVRVTANVFNLAGEDPTKAKFADLVRALSSAWKIDLPQGFCLVTSYKAKNRAEGDGWLAEIWKEKYNFGYGLILQFSAK